MNSKTETTPAPAFDAKSATPVQPYRHASGRTVVFHQQAEDKARTHLFSATGLFIATIATAAAAGIAEKAASDAKAAAAAADKANADEHAKRMAAAAAKPTSPSN